MQANEDGVREGRIAPERGAKVARLLEAALELARERDAILSVSEAIGEVHRGQ